MLDIALARKNKINLTDYDYKKDLNNRLLLSTLSEIELSTLDEIIYSSLKTSISKLLKRPVIPVIVIDDAKHAEPLAEALLKGGIDIIEITCRL